MRAIEANFSAFKRELLKTACRASLAGEDNLSLRQLVERMELPMQEGWGAAALAIFERDGFIKSLYGEAGIESEMVIGITGDGMNHAELFIEEDRPPTLIERIADDKFQKVGKLSISALSLLISVGALFVAIIALSSN